MALRRTLPRTVLLLLLLLLTGTPPSTWGQESGPTPAALPVAVYLPLVQSSCDLEPELEMIITSMRTHPEQRRPSLTCDLRLMRIASDHARDMATHGFVSHVSPTTGLGPNRRAILAGYQLPPGYGTEPTANTIESLVGGSTEAYYTWRGWMLSPGHKAHILGFADQTMFGIARASRVADPVAYDWVLVTAPPSP